jgi:hypothetical protein
MVSQRGVFLVEGCDVIIALSVDHGVRYFYSATPVVGLDVFCALVNWYGSDCGRSHVGGPL